MLYYMTRMAARALADKHTVSGTDRKPCFMPFENPPTAVESTFSPGLA